MSEATFRIDLFENIEKMLKKLFIIFAILDLLFD